MKNVTLQSLGLDLVNINVYAKVKQNIPNCLRVVGIFCELSGDKQLHKLSGEIIIDYRLESVDSSDAILSIIIGYSFFYFSMHFKDVSLLTVFYMYYY